MKKFPFYPHVGVQWLWVVDPSTETISVRALHGGEWKIVQEVVGGERLPLEPFGAVELPFDRLWLRREE